MEDDSAGMFSESMDYLRTNSQQIEGFKDLSETRKSTRYRDAALSNTSREIR